MRALLGAVLVAAAGWLAATDPGALGDAALRLAPVLGFVAAISVVVNLAARAGAFDTVVAALGRLPGMSGRAGAWALVTALAAVSTAFFSLDTTVILLTPVAVGLARARGLEVLALALPVIWTANIASLWLPVSNLTNLLADAAGRFDAAGGFTAAAWPVSGVAFLVALAASAAALLVYGRTAVPAAGGRSTRPGASGTRPGHAAAGTEPGRVGRDVGNSGAHRLHALSLVVLACTLPLLATPLPYWLTAAVAAGVLAGGFAVGEPGALRADLVPWGALLVAAALSVAAAAVHASGLSAGLIAALDRLGVPGTAAAGAVAANLVNNIPAYLALEPAAAAGPETLALLVGVNVGPLVTPWASLATLLWFDQLARRGEPVPWRAFVLPGLVLAPVAVALCTLAV